LISSLYITKRRIQLQIFERCNINSLSENSKISKISTTCTLLTITTKTEQSIYCSKSSNNNVDNTNIFCTINIDRNILLIVYISFIVIITNIFDNLILINFIIAKLLVKQSSKYLDN